jgi:hypothetical protein
MISFAPNSMVLPYYNSRQENCDSRFSDTILDSSGHWCYHEPSSVPGCPNDTGGVCAVLSFIPDDADGIWIVAAFGQDITSQIPARVLDVLSMARSLQHEQVQ